jgi:phage shock protein C
MDTKKLLRIQNGKMIAGVCGGLGEYLGIDPTIVRLIFVLLVLTGSLGLWLYLIMWVVVPLEGGQAIVPLNSTQSDASQAVLPVEEERPTD